MQMAGNPTAVVAVTPSDTVAIPGEVLGLYVGGTGNLAVVGRNGAAATLVGVAAGSIIPGEWLRVNSTGTAATNIVAFLK